MINKILPVAIMLAATTSASAEILNDTTPFVGEVNAALAGPELITPQFLELDYGQGGCTGVNGCVTVRFKVSKVVLGSNLKYANHKYFTPERRFNYPTNCQSVHEKDWDEKYVRIGNKMAIGMSLRLFCADDNQWTDSSNAFLYLTDASQDNGQTKAYYYPNHALVGIDKTENLNNFGSTTDLMVTVFEMSENNKNAKFSVYEPNNFNRYIYNSVKVDR